jgi:hypothetical protein
MAIVPLRCLFGAYMSQEMRIKLRHQADEMNKSFKSLIEEVERKLLSPGKPSH